jgi:pyridoxal phosphate enzyme (YggS family)
VSGFAQRLAAVEEQIAAACRHAGRPREEVRLMAVSKVHPVEALVEAAEAGLTLFGENRVQEFQQKSLDLESRGYSVEGADAAGRLNVHLIGHLQSNKAARAAEIFSEVDTLDSMRLAERLNEACSATGRTLPVLIEIKLSPEETKEGLTPDNPELLTLLDRLPDFPNLHLRGLMTVPQISDNPGVARTCFRELRNLRDRLAREYPRLSFDELSMGMSGDFAAAIEEGSTTIRIGTALFGARPKPA